MALCQNKGDQCHQRHQRNNMRLGAAAHGASSISQIYVPENKNSRTGSRGTALPSPGGKRGCHAPKYLRRFDGTGPGKPTVYARSSTSPPDHCRHHCPDPHHQWGGKRGGPPEPTSMSGTHRSSSILSYLILSYVSPYLGVLLKRIRALINRIRWPASGVGARRARGL